MEGGVEGEEWADSKLDDMGSGRVAVGCFRFYFVARTILIEYTNRSRLDAQYIDAPMKLA